MYFLIPVSKFPTGFGWDLLQTNFGCIFGRKRQSDLPNSAYYPKNPGEIHRIRQNSAGHSGFFGRINGKNSAFLPNRIRLYLFDAGYQHTSTYKCTLHALYTIHTIHSTLYSGGRCSISSVHTYIHRNTFRITYRGIRVKEKERQKKKEGKERKGE